MSTKYPLAIPVKAGIDVIKELSLRCETSLRDDINNYKEFSEVLFSAHAPIDVNGQRLNLASIDENFRRQSVERINGYIDSCSNFPNVAQLNLHFGYKSYEGQEGRYDHHIDSIRSIAQHASRFGIEIVLENLNSYWQANGISDETDWSEVDWEGKIEAFGMDPNEWIQMCLDVNRPNVALSLDSSHVCTYAHRFAEEDREIKINEFLSRPELIKHVHWSDNYLYDLRGRSDSHLSVGRGTLPVGFHQEIKRLDATILLEHFYSQEELKEELIFIESL
jgi:sugar phosphate isomerase/epimerase